MTKPAVEKEVVILLTDMIQYSSLTQHMRPEEIRDFITDYYHQLENILSDADFQPLTIDPMAGDGAVIIFEKREEGDRVELCSRALSAAMRTAMAMDRESIPATRMGLFLGDIIEAQLGERLHRFGSSFAVASRLEELCGYFDTTILMDREMARLQRDEREYIVAIGKITPKNFSCPYNLFSIVKPGLGDCPQNVDKDVLWEFVAMKNQAIEHFCGNLQTGQKPDFPLVRELLNQAQQLFYRMTGKRDVATERVQEYIREFPYPEKDFIYTGMKIGSKKGDQLGIRLFHLSKQLLRAIDDDLYNALVIDTEWEKMFKLEWRNQGEVIVRVGDTADGIYYIDRGLAHAEDAEGNIRAVFKEGSVFGEMAYYNKEKRRSATVIADTDVVLRKISNRDFEKFPVIKNIFQRLARKRTEHELPY